MITTTLLVQAMRIRDAIREPGSNPAFHQQVMDKHRAEWPYLWREIDVLLAFLDSVDKE